MAASKRWSPEAWNAAKSELELNGSIRELLALNEAGAISREEVIGAVWAHCYDKHDVADELIRVLQEDPSEAAQYVAEGIRELLRFRIASEK